MNYETALPLGSVIAIILTIIAYRKIMPTRLNGTFDKPVMQFLHDYFHFKKLYLEEVLKFLFTLATIACVVTGVLLLISYEENYHSYYYTSGGFWTKDSTFAYGLGLLIGGPVALRLAYESIMMFILLVKNTMEINNKLKVTEVTAETAESSAEQ